MKLQDKVVLITGSSSGIGKAMAIKFAKEGAKIVVNFKTNRKGAEEVVKVIKKINFEAFAIQADVANPIEVKRLFLQILNKYKTVDVLINNAGLAKKKDFLKITRRDLVEEFAKNFFSMVYCSQEAAKIMLKKGSGKIINMSSICGLPNTGCSTILTYTTAKAASISFTKTLAQALAPKITVNAVAPGFTLTRYWNGIAKGEESGLLNSTLLKRWIKADEIAEAFLYLAKNDAVTGQVLIVDGGYTLK